MGWDEFYKTQEKLGNYKSDLDAIGEDGVTSAGFMIPGKISEFNKAYEEEKRLQKIELDSYILKHNSHTHWWK